MKILHYMFGIPPVRGGGLIRYATDLMRQEMQSGEEVRLLIPGTIPIIDTNHIRIYKRMHDYLNVPTYVIDNPLPVPMCNGILDINRYTKSCDREAYHSFLCRYKPDIIHMHTLMGLHREFLEEAQRLSIPIVFTTHDYFGICPKTVMMFADRICDDIEWKNCSLCSVNAYSKRRLLIEHSRLYHFYRNRKWLVELFHKGIFKKSFKKARAPEIGQVFTQYQRKKENDNDYFRLKEYYKAMFQAVTYFHFNSLLAKELYQTRLNGMNGSVIPISHSGISDCRKEHRYGKILRLGYFGSLVVHKGFFELLDVCRELLKEGCVDIRLHIYSDLNPNLQKDKFIVVHPKFDACQLQETLDDIDLLVVPGKWPETFGLVVLEALSCGVPVIVSVYTGAKDLIDQDQGVGFVYDGTNCSLKEQIRLIYHNRNLLKEANTHILKMKYEFSYERHVEAIMNLYQMVMQEQTEADTGK